MAEEKKWTIMAYIAADDILSDFAVGSLQQLRRVASQEKNVVVVAQFDANGKQNIPRLIFEGDQDKSQSIHASKKAAIAADTDLADPRALTAFIDWAYKERPADHYCLVLWGHGPELLAADYPTLPDGQKAKKFLTPLDVKKGLAGSKLIADKRKFEIVAVDACNMSMVELACEIGDCAEFLVASEEDVPDFSFPYDRLLLLGQSITREEIARTCTELPKRYIDAYQDYILTEATQTESITLTSLSLKNAGMVTQPLRQLADALLAPGGREKRQAIINARANSQAFVAGLYVDLHDFCDRLPTELDSKRVNDTALVSACQSICQALQSRGNNAFIMANEVSKNERCHGLSIYFPYDDPEQNTTKEQLERGEVHDWKNGSEIREKGGMEARTRGIEFPGRSGKDASNQSGVTVGRVGTDARNRGAIGALNKGSIGALNKGSIGALNKERRQRIEETEQYYPELKILAETHWTRFIRHCWSRWLVEDAEEKVQQAAGTETSEILNQHYSAQQCALNLLSLCRELEKDPTESRRANNTACGFAGQEKPVPVNRGLIS